MPAVLLRAELRRAFEAGALAGGAQALLAVLLRLAGVLELQLAMMAAGSGLLQLALWWVSRRVVVSRYRLFAWRLALLVLLGLQVATWGLFLLQSPATTPAWAGGAALAALLLCLVPAAYWMPGYLALLGEMMLLVAVGPAAWQPWLYPPLGGAVLAGGLVAWLRHRARMGQREALGQLGRQMALQEALADSRAQLDHEREQHQRCEAQLAEVRELAESANRAKTEFLATISHEIRTPLNGILPILDLLQSTRLDDEQRRYVRTALNSSRHLLRIINDILDYARAESGKLQLESIEVNLHELIQGVLDLMAGSAERKGLRLELQIGEQVPPVVRSDPIRLRQILTNLVSNAIKFTERGGVTVTVECQRAAVREVELRFSVTDTGIGLSREAVSRLFDSFTQADASTTRKHGGTGLGLAICRRLVELMGGSIGVRSRPGEGSTFWFVLPLRRSVHDVPNQRHNLEGLRLLTVIPDAATEEEIARELAAWGVQHEQAHQGEVLQRLLDAASLGRSWAFEAVLIDAWGNEHRLVPLLRSIRSEPRLQELQVILASRSEEGARRLQREFGVQVLPGGLRPQPLKRLLHRLFDVASGASYEAEQEDLLGFRDLNLDEERALDEPPAEPASTPAPSNGMRVLLVEDNPVNSGVMRRVLERLGVACEVAENGRLGLEALAAQRFDLVLMDCQMPVMDGYQATRAWRRREAEQGGHIPIIAMTANAMQGDREKCLEAGMDDYLAKPVGIETLAAMLSRWGVTAEVQAKTPQRQAERPSGAERRMLDRDVLEELREVMEDGFADLVRTYLENAPTLVAQLREAAEARELQAMIVPAHSLKSSSANMGAMHLSGLAKAVEIAAREGRLEEALQAWRELPECFEATCRALRAEIGEG